MQAFGQVHGCHYAQVHLCKTTQNNVFVLRSQEGSFDFYIKGDRAASPMAATSRPGASSIGEFIASARFPPLKNPNLDPAPAECERARAAAPVAGDLAAAPQGHEGFPRSGAPLRGGALPGGPRGARRAWPAGSGLGWRQQRALLPCAHGARLCWRAQLRAPRSAALRM